MRHSDWLPSSSSPFPQGDIVDLAMEIIYNNKLQSKTDLKDLISIQKIVENIWERSSMDVTDQLWNLMSVHCSTYGKLVDCLNAFITEIAYNQKNIYIADLNHTVLAELLRGIIAGKMAVPTLTGTQPIEILIELGIEKLRKDYVYIFKTANIKTEEELNNLLK